MTESLTQTLFLIIKTLAIIGLVLYVLFSAIIVRQEHLMANVLEEQFEPFVRLVTLIHLGAALLVLLLAFVLLP